MRGWPASVIAYGGVLLVALLVRLGCLQGMDLTDLPGPGGVKMVTALAVGNYGRDWATWLAASTLPLFGGDIVLTCRVLMILGGLAGVLGAMLAAHALVGRWGAIATGLITAVWAQSIYIAVLVGADALSVGFAWLGIGLVWFAACQGWWGLGLALVGTLCALFAVAIKVNALPVMALLGIAPLLVPLRSWRRGLALALTIGGAFWMARWGFLPAHSGHVQDVPSVGLDIIRQGLDRLVDFARRNPEGLSVLQIFSLGCATALLPGRRWLQRILLALGSVLLFGFAMEAIGAKIRIRQMFATCLPVVILLGSGLGLVQEGLGALLARLARPLRWLPWLLTAAVVVLLSFDALAFMHGYSQQRVTKANAAPSTLPRPPLAWERAYHKMTGLVFESTSGYGSADLFALAAEAPPGGVATIPLRDSRHFHLTAAAGLAGRPFRAMEAARCCEGGASSDCAAEVVRMLDRAGAWLVLPDSAIDGNRIPLTHHGWNQQLLLAASEAGALEKPSRWWYLFKGSGGAGPLPCRPSAR